MAIARLDPVEELAIDIFKRDHPHRIWRTRSSSVFGSDAETLATAEERRLYSAFARTRLAEAAGLLLGRKPAR